MNTHSETNGNDKTSGLRKRGKPIHAALGIALLITGLLIIFSGVRSITDSKIRAFAPKGFITLEVADTEAERKIGLMNRQKLEQDAGMLFRFDGPQDAGCFWMKDTFISLDIVWLNADNKVIHVHTNATPRSEQPICPDENGAYVIEVNAGRAEELGLVEGATVRF